MNPGRIRITSEKQVSVADLVDEATRILTECRSIEPDNRLSRTHASHHEFCTSYPIVARFICQLQYDPTVFRKWLLHVERNPWTSASTYLDAHADYVVMLFRVPHMRSTIRAELQAEHDMFTQCTKKCERSVDADDTVRKMRNAVELRTFIALAGAPGLAMAETIRVESDIEPQRPAYIAAYEPRELVTGCAALLA